jgi:hypothetical protein
VGLIGFFRRFPQAEKNVIALRLSGWNHLAYLAFGGRIPRHFCAFAFWRLGRG